MDFQKIIERQKEERKMERWEGSLLDYLTLIKENPDIASLAPERVYNAIISKGVEDVDESLKLRGYEDLVRYKFFDNKIFGTLEPIHDIMKFLKAAARRTETGKRILILVGPVSSGKSTITALLKRGLEDCDFYGIKGCPIHENPLHAIPVADRDYWQEELGITIEGNLCPVCQWKLDNELTENGIANWDKFQVEKLRFSEQRRIGIGTFSPHDPKNQDVTELIGRVNMAKVARYGETDPRAFSFDGELQVANRGMIEMVELLKCLSGDAIILTDKGLFPISRLFEEDLTIDTTKLRISNGCELVHPLAIVEKGKEDVFKITTKKGYSIKCTSDHRFKVFSDGKLDWKEVKDLKPSMIIPIQRGKNIWASDFVPIPEEIRNYVRENSSQHPVLEEDKWRKDINVEEAIKLYCETKNLSYTAECFGCSLPTLYRRGIHKFHPNFGANLPEIVTPALGRLLGYAIAEGWIGKSALVIAATNEDIIEDLTQIGKEIEIDVKWYGGRSVHFGSVKLIKFLKYCGWDFHKAKDKKVPWVIFNSPKEVVCEFLKGYFSGDGTCSSDAVCCSSASEILIEQIQQILLNLGIVAKKGKLYSKKYSRHYHSLTITGHNIVKFKEEIGFVPQYKRERLEKISSQVVWEKSYKDIIPVFKELKDMYKEARKNGFSPKYHSDNDQTFFNVFRKKKGSYSIVSRMINNMAPFADRNKIDKILEEDFFFDQIVSIEKVGREKVFDIALLSEDHTFCANGFVSHNCDPRLMYVLISLAQEQVIKSPGFPQMYIDTLIVGHTNCTEFDSFKADKKNEALHDRMYPIYVPWNLRVDDEVKIYEKMIKESSFRGIHIAPHTLKMAAEFAVLTRLTESSKVSNKVEKMKIYNGEITEGFKKTDIDVKELRQEGRDKGEGMKGISPRFIINALNVALGTKEDKKCVNPIDVIRALRENFSHQMGIEEEDIETYKNLLLGEKDSVNAEYKEIAKKEVNMAFLYAYDDQAEALFENYMRNVTAYCLKEKVYDSVTGEYSDPDEKLMRSLEELVPVPENSKSEFRNGIFVYKSTALEQGKKFSYKDYPPLKDAIEKKLMADLKPMVSTALADKSVTDPKAKKRREKALQNLLEKGYCQECASVLLAYVGEILRRES